MKHCSEEQLLEWLDGEVSPTQRMGIEKHVVECWRCRTALQTLEEDIATVVRKFRSVEASHAPDRIALGRILSACNSSADTAVRPSIARSEAAWWPFVAVAAACLVFILVAMLAPSPVRPAPREIALAAERLEKSPARGARLASQTLDIVIEETRPAHRSRQLRLRVWTDLTRSRSAVHWGGGSFPPPTVPACRWPTR